MCGIVAIINKHNSEQLVKTMLEKIIHRGDSQPAFDSFDNKTFLGSVRLKIVDRHSGRMPLYNEDKTIVTIFNGEIYNHKDLRLDLITKGHKFSTEADTEVLVHLYEEYGLEMLTLLDGMFAFVIYSPKTKQYIAARDRWGIKPLYFSHKNDSLFIASEIKAFDGILEIDNIEELRPGHYIYNGEINSFFQPSYELSTLSYDHAKAKVRNLLEEAVKKRVDTDLPIAVFLSGGVDSSIVYLLACKYHLDVTAIVIGKDDSSDVICAKRLCDLNNSKCLHINISQDEFLSNIPEVIKTIETFEPNPVRGSALSFYLASFAKEKGFKVVLCGEGSDEIFAGYGDFIGLDSREFQILTKNFVSDLYRTQLLRIDKTGMAFGVEIREPFMDNKLVQLAISLPPEYKVRPYSNRELTKYILRDAFKDILPDFIFSRDKKTLMEGAGANSVQKGEGIFYEYASKNLPEQEFNDIQKKYPEYNLSTVEDAFYFKIYKEKYGLKVSNSSNRTFNALKEIR